MKTTVLLELPWPPSANRYWRALGRGHVVVSKEGRLYREAVMLALWRHEVERMNGEVEIQVKLYPPDRRRRDIDNSLKILLDALQHGGLYENDAQIRKLTVERCGIQRGGKVLVWVEEHA